MPTKFRLKKFAKILFLILGSMVWSRVEGQAIYAATTAKVSFFAGTPIEDIDATNEKAISFINIQTGEVIVSIPNNAFHFRRPLMEEHFNENYMESGKFPKSEFKGRIDDLSTIQWGDGKTYNIQVTGMLSIHGVNKPRTLQVQLISLKSRIDATTQFKVPLSDHNIDRPKILWEKLAEEIDVRANIIYEPHKK